MIKRHSLLALSGVVIVSSRVCSLCWLRLCSLEYLQMWSLLQSLYSVLYKLKLCLLLLDVCAAQCAAATPQDHSILTFVRTIFPGVWEASVMRHGGQASDEIEDDLYQYNII